jgi:hypothetical protein
VRGGWIALALIALLGVALAAPAARADTGDIIAPQHSPPEADDGWQAGVCTLPTCDPTTPAEFYTQAAGRPPFGFTQFIVKSEPPGETPVGTIKDVRVDLPVGLSVNPQATPQCPLATFEQNAVACALSIVGESSATLSVPPLGTVVPPVPGVTQVPVYNLEPANGEPALFGFSVGGQNVFLKADIEWNGDYHEGFTIAVPESPLGTILKNRLVFSGRAGAGAFLTNPSTCHDPAQSPFQHIYSTYLRADSAQAANPSFPAGSSQMESPLPPGVMPTGCAGVPFNPGVATAPGTTKTDSPAGATAEATVPFEPLALIANSNVKTASVTLPKGMGLNPSAADALVFCTDQQLGKGTRAPVSCPAKSKIGTATIETPPLPAGALTGNVYLGKQLSRDPTSGDEYRIFLDAESARYGISVRLVGRVSADPQTGQLTTTFADNPQVPFTSLKVKFDGGAKAVLTSPPTCGPNTTTGRLVPYTETPPATPQQQFMLKSAAGGGACDKTLASRPFNPGFTTSSKTAKAGSFSSFGVHIARGDGQQEVKGVDIALPPGISGKLAGVPYCPPKDIAAAGDRAGAAEKKNSSCPAKSMIGTASVTAGSGSSPVSLKGKAFLAGPYNGAPLSLAVITPATAGPFDLGTVVVRVALFVDPETAQIHPVSDPIPDVFGGAKLDLRTIDVNADKHDFIVNPTSCGQLSTAGALLGGGANPASPSAFSSFPVSAGFKTKACRRLGFHPRLFTKMLGGRKTTGRAQHPKFRATLVARKGEANVARTIVTLPRSLLIDQSHIQTICTRPKLEAHNCPKKSVYGHAKATSPLLGKPLKGPVYLVPSKHALPDLLADLHGQVGIRLRGTVTSVDERIRNVFPAVPDVPVSKFALTMDGGKRGLLETTRDLCRHPSFSKVSLKAQNGKRAHKVHRVRLRVPGCHPHKRKGGHHRH